jgi:hypothetical protein
VAIAVGVGHDGAQPQDVRDAGAVGIDSCELGPRPSVVVSRGAGIAAMDAAQSGEGVALGHRRAQSVVGSQLERFDDVVVHVVPPPGEEPAQRAGARTSIRARSQRPGSSCGWPPWS